MTAPFGGGDLDELAALGAQLAGLDAEEHDARADLTFAVDVFRDRVARICIERARLDVALATITGED